MPPRTFSCAAPDFHISGENEPLRVASWFLLWMYCSANLLASTSLDLPRYSWMYSQTSFGLSRALRKEMRVWTSQVVTVLSSFSHQALKF